MIEKKKRKKPTGDPIKDLTNLVNAFRANRAKNKKENKLAKKIIKHMKR